MDIRAESVDERAILLGKTRSLTGIITVPACQPVDCTRPALIILNAGLVHRVGPNRLHVKVARRIAHHGFVSARFDFSGIGESLPRRDHMPYAQSAVLEVREVMDALTEQTGIRSFCLMGLSSGALVSLATALEDTRVVGAAIINPHGFADSTQWGRHVDQLSESRIYRRNLLNPHSWGRLLTGKTNYGRLVQSLWYRMSRPTAGAPGIASVVHEMRPRLSAFLRLGIRIVLLFSEKDRSIVNFDEILGDGWSSELGGNVDRVVIPEANHTFAGPAQLESAVASIERWMTTAFPVPANAHAPTASNAKAVSGT